MHKVALLFVLAAACGGTEDREAETSNGSGGAGGQAQGTGGGAGPTTSTYIFECSREGGTQWSLLAASMQADDACAFLKVVRPATGGTIEDAGLAIEVPEGAFLTEARGARGAVCDEAWASWLEPVSGSGAVAFTATDAAGDPTEMSVAVTLTFDDASSIAPVVFEAEQSFVCND